MIKVKSCPICNGYNRDEKMWTQPIVRKNSTGSRWLVQCRNGYCRYHVCGRFKWLTIHRWNRIRRDEK